MKKKITIVGSGKVATQIAHHLKNRGHFIDGVWGRTAAKVLKLADSIETKQLYSLSEISSDSIALVCVSDGAIHEVIKQIAPSIKVAYTSGSINMNELEYRKYLGVFYPLQTFSEDRQVNISEVPFLIEANSDDFETELKTLAESISSYVILADSQDRYNTHIAAVLVNNFTNFLYYLAQQHLQEHHLDFDILKPLIKETVNKLDTLSPMDAQTGPAARGDMKVIEKHIASIKDPKFKDLYSLFSELIYKKIHTK